MANLTSGPTIQAGASLSDALNVSGTVAQIITPDDWTPALLTFQVSQDQGVSFYDFIDVNNAEVMMAIRTRALINLPGSFNAVNNTRIKFRSGTRDFPVAQLAQRVFQILTV